MLPGKVTKLGTGHVTVGPRRPIKTSARHCEIRGGEYVASDRASWADSLRAWLPQAKEGNARAQTYVGEIFEKGLGVTPDYATAAEWYQLAAEQGYGPAQINLGQLYEQGKGVPNDPKTALQWYRRATGISDLDEGFVSFREDAAAYHRSRRELERANPRVGELREEATGLILELGRVKERRAELRERLSTEEAELAELRTELESGEVDRRQAQIAMRRGELAELDAAIEQKLGEAESRREEYGDLVKPNWAIVGPSIHIVDPELLRTRSTSAASVLVQSKERAVIGRVEAPAGLLFLMVNDLKETVDEHGFFESKIRVRRMGTRVEIVAVDRQGKRAVRTFLLHRGQEGGRPTTLEPERLSDSPDAGVRFGRYFALVIGNSNYKHLPKLSTSRADASAVSRILEKRYGFEVETLMDADRHAILTALNSFREKLAKTDNLIIYYAGHGDYDEVNDRGFWLPVDAEPDNNANWISNQSVTDFVNVTDARHVLIVADSCYSGALTGGALPRLAPEFDARAGASLRKMVDRRSRTALTSGGLAPVLDAGGGDHSVFAAAFIHILDENDRVMNGFDLYTELSARVTYRARLHDFEQEPRYAAIRFGGHESGDFFFVPKR